MTSSDLVKARSNAVHLIDLLFDKTLCGRDAAVKSRWPKVKWTIDRERATCRACAKSQQPWRASL